MTRFVSVLVALGALLAGATAEARVRRHAIVIGANEGDASEVRLKYAESDAQRIARVLREHGEFPPENVLVLVDGEADDVRRALIGMNSRVRDEGGESVLFVFYSGHADADSLHIRGTRLDTRELRDLVYGSPAGARILVIDACRSGSVTRTKGGTVAAPFVIDVEAPLAASGVAILTSSAAGEDSQESDALQASFFTHYLASALIGAGDQDGDGRVSIAEAFSYASERTLVATAATVAGPQHPTYRFELGGHGDLVLTEPGRQQGRFGALQFSTEGTFLVQRGGKDGGVVGEITTAAGVARRLALPRGGYQVTLRTPKRVLEGSFQVEPGGATAVEPALMREVPLARLVRKGAYGKNTAWEPFVMGSVRGDVHNLGRTRRLDVGVHLDLPAVALELRAGGGRSEGTISSTVAATGETITRPVEAREVTVTFGASRVFDIARFSIGAGGEAGGMLLERRVVPEFARVEERFPEQSDVGFVLGPVTYAETRIWGRLVARVDAGWLLFVADPIDLPRRQENPVWQSTYRVGLGLGIHF